MEKPDFSGYVTRNDIRCTDGRVIKRNAFAHNDGATVPLMYQHLHDDPSMILGKVKLENRQDGVYGYCYLNDSQSAKDVKLAVLHGDINSMSIYANRLSHNKGDVLHGDIKEVSVVLAGANPGAKIDNICLAHADGSEDVLDDEAIIYSGQPIDLDSTDSNVTHSEITTNTTAMAALAGAKAEQATQAVNDIIQTPKTQDSMVHSSETLTVGDVLDTFNDDQKMAMMAVLNAALNKQEENEGGDDNMSHNAFENAPANEDVLSHADEEAIFADVKRYGSLKESTLAHGITNIDYLIPDPKTINPLPEFIKRPTEWVDIVMNSVHKTPFSRIKSVFADITEDDARAKGYIKGKLKKEEVFSLLKRTTMPTTVYKKQKLDRDDQIDIDSMATVVWIKSEMRMMLDEELARAFLIGDGRPSSSDDKINESNIRPIWTDNELYTTRVTVEGAATLSSEARAKAFITKIIKARKNYKGSGNPILFTTEDMVTDCLLLTDANGRDLYEDVAKLAKKLRVSDIVTVSPMENATREADSKKYRLYGIIVNLKDYNVGADKGGAINMFDDFDIDYNAQKYLIETRCSGALIKPYSAIAIEGDETATTTPPSAG